MPRVASNSASAVHMALSLGARPTLVAAAIGTRRNLKDSSLLDFSFSKKIAPFNIAYVNFHCRGRDRLLECFMVEGAVP